MNHHHRRFNILQRVDESAVVYGRRVDDFLNELSITVGVGCGDVNENLQVLHPVGQCQHLLGGQDIQLHCISERKRERRGGEKGQMEDSEDEINSPHKVRACDEQCGGYFHSFILSQ